MGWQRGLRAMMIGALAFLFGMIFVPQCGVPVYAQNAAPLSAGLAAVVIYFGYRFR